MVEMVEGAITSRNILSSLRRSSMDMPKCPTKSKCKQKKTMRVSMDKKKK